MDGRIYAVNFDRVSITTAVDLFELTPADDKPIEIVGLELTQTSDFGDAQDELLTFAFVRGNTTAGSGGSTATPRPAKRGASAAGFTAKTNNTTAASAGSPVTTHQGGFNVRAGYLNWFPAGTETDATQADTLLVVRLLAAPADSLTVSGTLYVREVG
jgi:hypothetical protein